MSNVSAVLLVPIGGAQETGDQQARKLGGVRGVQGLQGSVSSHAVRAGVLRERPEIRPGRCLHVFAVTDTGRFQAATTRVCQAICAHADAHHQRQRGRVATQGDHLP